MTPRLAIESLCKRFAAPVLRDVSMAVAPGSIHGLVGENGAGKSTLINIVSGLLPADSGSLRLNGASYRPGSRRQALDHGIALAAQEMSLIDTLTVAENILLANLPQHKLAIDRERLIERSLLLMNRVDLRVSPQAAVAELTLAERQLVELAKALSMPESACKLLILDEPTSALTSPQADRLHSLLTERAAQGLSIIYVSHRLDDVLSVCDEVSVLRDGQIVLTAPTSGLGAEDLIHAMCGEELLADDAIAASPRGPIRLRVEALSSAEFPEPISLQCHSGEIVGIAGLAGAGRSELLHAIFGLGERRSGKVLLSGEAEVSIDSPSTAVRHGMAMIAEDRKAQGLFGGKSLAMNTTIAGLGRLGGALAAVLPRRELDVSERLLQKLKVKSEGPRQDIDRLSGGNQQKVLFARWLQTEADVWLLDEPTRGVDIGAKLAIHQQLRRLRDQGAAILIVSSELEELTALCDRILVLSARRVAACYERGQWSKELLLDAAFSQFKNSQSHAGAST